VPAPGPDDLVEAGEGGIRVDALIRFTPRPLAIAPVAIRGQSVAGTDASRPPAEDSDLTMSSRSTMHPIVADEVARQHRSD